MTHIERQKRPFYKKNETNIRRLFTSLVGYFTLMS